MCQNISECLKLNRPAFGHCLLLKLVNFIALVMGQNTCVLMFWIARDKLCFSEAHLADKKWELKLKVFNSFMGILKIIKDDMCFSFLESRIWKNLSIVL